MSLNHSLSAGFMSDFSSSLFKDSKLLAGQDPAGPVHYCPPLPSTVPDTNTWQILVERKAAFKALMNGTCYVGCSQLLQSSRGSKPAGLQAALGMILSVQSANPGHTLTTAFTMESAMRKFSLCTAHIVINTI